jgi:hypothetical protein
VALAAAATLVVRPVKVAVGDYTASDLSHFEGPMVPAGFRDHAARLATSLHTADHRSNRTFLLMPSASFYYLLAGLDDPTRFDYPLVDIFGRFGQEEVIGEIRRGAVRHVCVGSFVTYRGLQPRTLMRYVRVRMVRIRDLGATRDAGCTLYRRSPESSDARG